jgi:hypothetical protein
MHVREIKIVNKEHQLKTMMRNPKISTQLRSVLLMKSLECSRLWQGRVTSAACLVAVQGDSSHSSKRNSDSKPNSASSLNKRLTKVRMTLNLG